MAKSAQEAMDKGFTDGYRHATGERTQGIGHVLSELFSPCYRGDRDFPESYREGFREGEKTAWQKK